MVRDTRRLSEWGLALLVVLTVTAYFFHEYRYVEAQSELAAVKTTLGSLRTTLLLEHLKAVADGTLNSKPVQRNPFLLLDPLPPNYAGVLADAKSKIQLPGTWVFDAFCNCIGYRPLNPAALSTQPEGGAIWFRISAPPGPLQVTAMHAYLWQALPLD